MHVCNVSWIPTALPSNAACGLLILAAEYLLHSLPSICPCVHTSTVNHKEAILWLDHNSNAPTPEGLPHHKKETELWAGTRSGMISSWYCQLWNQGLWSHSCITFFPKSFSNKGCIRSMATGSRSQPRHRRDPCSPPCSFKGLQMFTALARCLYLLPSSSLPQQRSVSCVLLFPTSWIFTMWLSYALTEDTGWLGGPT